MWLLHLNLSNAKSRMYYNWLLSTRFPEHINWILKIENSFWLLNVISVPISGACQVIATVPNWSNRLNETTKEKTIHGMHFKFTHANEIRLLWAFQFQNCTKLTVLLTVKVNLFIAFELFCVWVLLGRAIKWTKRSLSKRSNLKSVYCELLVGKMLSTVCIVTVTTVRCILYLVIYCFLKCSCVQAFSIENKT